MSLPRVAVVGRGRWGKIWAKTILAASDAVRFAWIAGRDWQKRCTNDRPDLLVVATPPNAHAEIALAAQLPVIIEKPLACSVAEGRALARLAETVPVLAMHAWLWDERWLAYRAACQGATFRARWGDRGPHRPETAALWDWAPHPLSMILDADPDLRVEAAAVRSTGNGEIWTIRLAGANNTSAIAVTGNGFEIRARLLIAFCPSGRMRTFLGDERGSREPPMSRALRSFAHDPKSTHVALGERVVGAIATADAAATTAQATPV